MTNDDLFPQERADELLARMTIDEKAAQVSAVMPLGLFGLDGPIRSVLDKAMPHGVGHVSALGTFGHKDPLTVARSVNAVQRYLVEHTRLGIPAIFHNEALNGVVAPGFTVFPTAIGLAATWSPEKVAEMSDVIRRQMRSVGLLQALAPVMDVARDARWGRVHETYGEDQYLSSEFSVAFTRGLQGDDLRAGVIATAKHFLGYAMTEAGQNMAASHINPRELVEVYARPFEAAIRIAGLASVMNSYAEVDGIPVGASREVLTNLLRGELGFAGTVVSDYMTVAMLQNRQRVAATAEEAGALALAAGLDVELPAAYGYGATLAEAVRSGVVPESQLDESVRRVLRDKFALGLFENPYVDEGPVVIRETAQLGAELSAELAAAAVTLLKNEGGVLPLSAATRRIAVVGPHADEVLVGFPGYTYPSAIGLMAAMAGGGEGSMAGLDSGEPMTGEAMAAMGAEIGPLLVTTPEAYARDRYPAASLAEAIRAEAPDAEVVAVTGVGVLPLEPQDIEAAVAAAQAADVVVLALGGRGGWFGGATEGEGIDASDIDLPSHQLELARAVVATGTPAVAVVSLGRPYGLAALEELVPGIVLGFYGGPNHGRALAAALFGSANPGGKLPYTLPRTTGQVPIHSGQPHGTGYRRSADDMHKGYGDGPSTPLYAFGHGLSYTTFEYSDLTLASATVATDGAIEAEVVVRNAGERAGDEVVQLYLADTAAGLTRPALQLVGFARVSLEPGASAQVTARIPLSVISYIGRSGERVVEAGPMTLHVGAASDDLRASAHVEVVGQTVVVAGSREMLSSVTTQALVDEH